MFRVSMFDVILRKQPSDYKMFVHYVYEKYAIYDFGRKHFVVTHCWWEPWLELLFVGVYFSPRTSIL